jgi:hypothetical protein
MRSDKPSDHEERDNQTGRGRPSLESGLPTFDPHAVREGHSESPDDESREDVDEDDDDPDLDDEPLGGEVETEPRTVLITGACGNLGRKLRAAWADVYDLVLIDKTGGPDDSELVVADLAFLDDDWITHFHGVDTVVHLAANSDELSPWEELIRPNLDAVANVFHAAALAGVERIIFASSNHIMGGYQHQGDEPITTHQDPRPDGPYAVTKLVGERLGRSLSRAFDLTFIALRLGWIQEGKNRPDTLPDNWARQMWLSNADLIRLFDCAVEAEIEDRSFIVVNGMSRNHGMRWDLSEAAELLGYLPQDDAFAGVPSGAHREQSR